ncbi:5-hydroxytryptamine receptor 3A-like [Solea senegalensis]|uniref:5-hydroxytryptamine receptor 3A-like n=2 Tax=Solea senegalensis TaxID=28829 RepID=A0AAV6RPP8_SOLSE|nr:5-hydroxytryptamine receptor 3A-like isoform X2 [Solea senegalensis]KAG7506623.1 5-hydroxytryptamine receptor 3A-like [Solea senegalensis]
MMFVSLFFLFLLMDGASSKENCSYQDVLNHLNLNYNNKLFYMTRPVINYTTVTEVNLDLLLYAILEMKEKEQLFVPYVWITMWWNNDYISWNPDEFCGISSLSVPTEIMWKPDLTIEETIEKDSAPPSPYVTITSRGNVELTNDQVLVSTCRMQVYRFPFDTQSCNLTFKSFIHSDEEIKLVYYGNSSAATEESRELMRTQSEWLFINITVTSQTIQYYSFNQTLVIYTINMKRRSALYIVNFLLPIVFFLCLDLASFLISDSGGEKLSFKITVLLAVTVMQLILNDILPSSSNRIPLIATYCIGIFALMMLSLLESVFVMYLTEKDNAPQDNETDEDLKLSEDKRDKTRPEREVNKLSHSTSGCDVSPIKTPSEMLPVAKEDGNIQQMKVSLANDELSQLIKTLTLHLSSRKEEAKPGYWTRVAKRINNAFFLFYFSVASLFLIYMFFKWVQ